MNKISQRQIPRCRRCGRIPDTPEAFTLCQYCRRLPSELPRPPLVQINAAPPCDLVSEVIVLGWFLLDRAALDASGLCESDFYAPIHSAVFSAVKGLRDPTPTHLAHWLSIFYDGEKPPIPLEVYALKLMHQAVGKEDEELQARVSRVKEASARRRRIEAARQTIKAAHDFYLPLEEVDARINHAFREARNG